MLGLLEASGGRAKGKGVDALHDEAALSLAVGNEALTVRCLLALAELCTEVECSEHLGAIGGHQSVLCLMMGGRGTAARVTQRVSDKARERPLDEPRQDDFDDFESGDEDEVQAAAAQVAAHVVASGCSFPMRASLEGSLESGRLPLRYDFAINLDNLDIGEDRGNSSTASSRAPTCRATAGTRGTAWESPNTWKLGHDALETAEVVGSKISILVRPVRQRQQSQFDVGFQMWPAAAILARWLCQNPHVLGGRRVLEVGAGLGLSGIVAAHMAAEVTLSDFNPVVLRALEANVALNAGWNVARESVESEAEGHLSDQPCECDCDCRDEVTQPGGAGARVAIDTPGAVRVRHLDWDKLRVPAEEFVLSGVGDEGGHTKSLGNGERFDVIIASDHICQVGDSTRVVDSR